MRIPLLIHSRCFWTVALWLCITLLANTDSAQANHLLRTAFCSNGLSASGGPYRLSGTAGEAGPVGWGCGGGYCTTAGFWSGFVLLNPAGIPDTPNASEVTWQNSLKSSSPNPFSELTTVVYSVAKSAPVNLAVYDVRGSRITTLVSALQSPGEYVVHWSGLDAVGRPVPTGFYFYRLQIGPWLQTQKTLWLR